MTPVTIVGNSRIANYSDPFFSARCLWESGDALYAVVETTAPDIAVLKSIDSGATWTELDAANAPATHNAGYPYDAYPVGTTVHIAYFSAANTITVIPFSTTTDTYGSSLGDATTGAASGINIRVLQRADGDVLVFYISSSDATLVRVARCEATVWTDATAADMGNACRIIDAVMDRNDIATVFYNDSTANDTTYVSFTGANAASSAVDLDATSSGNWFPTTNTSYDVAGVDTWLAGYLDSSGGLKAITVGLDGTAPHTSGSEQTVFASSSGMQSGSFFRFGATNYCVWYDASGTDIQYQTSTDGATWAAAVEFVNGTFLMGHANAVLGGVGVVYQSNADIIFDWIVRPPSGGNLPIPLAAGRRPRI